MDGNKHTGISQRVLHLYISAVYPKSKIFVSNKWHLDLEGHIYFYVAHQVANSVLRYCKINARIDMLLFTSYTTISEKTAFNRVNNYIIEMNNNFPDRVCLVIFI